MPNWTVMQWSYTAISHMPKSIYGVYAFWCRDIVKCIYVGQAKERPIQTRLSEHWRGSHNETLILWIKAFGNSLEIHYVSAERESIDALERNLIRALNPEANKQHNQ